MNSEAVSALVAKNPSLKGAKAKLEAMEVVIHFEESSFDIPLTIVSAGQ